MSERLELVTVRTAHSVVDIEPTPLEQDGHVRFDGVVFMDGLGVDRVELDGILTKADLARILILMVEAEEKSDG